MTRFIVTLALAAAALSGCQLDEPTLGGTVLKVAEAERIEREPSPARYDDPLWPEVAWRIEVRLDNGDEVTVIHNGERRYSPGERVHVLPAGDGALLL